MKALLITCGASWIRGENRCVIGASVGIACFPGDADSRDDLLSCADRALYTAKGSGKGTYRFWSAPVA